MTYDKSTDWYRTVTIMQTVNIGDAMFITDRTEPFDHT